MSSRQYMLWVLVAVCLLPIRGTALIDPKFTPIDLAGDSKNIVHISLTVSDDTSTMTSKTITVLKGEDLTIETIKIPFRFRSDLADVVESNRMKAVLIYGDHSGGASGDSGAGIQLHAMLKTDAGWFGLYGKNQPYTLGDSPFDLRKVWEGSADMLAAAFKYILTYPARAEIPVNVGVKWKSASKYKAQLSNVHALIPVMTHNDERLLFAASSDGDKIFKIAGDGSITEVSSGMKLSSSSLKAAWSDMNADGRLDLLSWSGKRYTLYSVSSTGTTRLSSMPDTQAPYSLCGTVLESNSAAVIIAGTKAGPQIVRFSSEGKQLSSTPVATLADKTAGGPCAVADFTGDGINDIAEITKTHILLYEGKSKGQFNAPVKSAETYEYSFLLPPLVCDINGDGHLDLLVSGADGVSPYINLGNKKFMSSIHVSGELGRLSKPNVISASTADFNNDGKQEFILFYKDLGPMPFFNRGFACFGSALKLEVRDSGLSVSDSITRGQQAGVTADMDGDGKQETIIVTAAGDLIVLETTSRSDRPLLSLEASPGHGEISPCRVTAKARAQVMGARNANMVFPAFWGIRHKGPVDLIYKDKSSNAGSIRKIVIKPSNVRIESGK